VLVADYVFDLLIFDNRLPAPDFQQLASDGGPLRLVIVLISSTLIASA
jgi:hypothetical protein